MSDLLEQAIVDATALKEAAIRNAEQAIIEKFKPRIETAVTSILNEDERPSEEDFLAGLEGSGEDILGTGATELDPGAISGDVPLAATDDENLCGCPENDEEIEIDFGELEQQIAMEDSMETDELGLDGGMEDELGLDDLGLGDEEELALEEEDLLAILQEEDEKIEESFPSDKKFKVDVEQVPSGTGLETPTADKQLATVEALAKANELEEELKDTQKKMELVNEELKKIKELNKKFRESNTKYKNTLLEVKNKVKTVNLMNIKLLYKNKVLGNASLNERQKSKFVESISKAETADAVKTLFESFNDGATDSSSKEQELSESFRKNINDKSASTVILQRRKETARETITESKTPQATRWQKLAGINNKPKGNNN